MTFNQFIEKYNRKNERFIEHKNKLNSSISLSPISKKNQNLQDINMKIQ